MGLGGSVRSAVPGRGCQILIREQQRGGEVKQVQAAQSRARLAACSTSAWSTLTPLVSCAFGRPGRQPNGANSLDIAATADQAVVGFLHGISHEFVSGFSDVAFDQRARVQVQAQRSSPRSTRINRDPGCDALAIRGARPGRARLAGTTQPSPIRRRSQSSPPGMPAGTMSASGRPRRVTGTGSRRPTPRRTSDEDSVSSRTPISRMCRQY
jgi:hypothetical protein